MRVGEGFIIAHLFVVNLGFFLTWNFSILFSILNNMKIVSCGFWANSHARKVTLQQISDENMKNGENIQTNQHQHFIYLYDDR